RLRRRARRRLRQRLLRGPVLEHRTAAEPVRAGAAGARGPQRGAAAGPREAAHLAGPAHAARVRDAGRLSPTAEPQTPTGGRDGARATAAPAGRAAATVAPCRRRRDAPQARPVLRSGLRRRVRCSGHSELLGVTGTSSGSTSAYSSRIFRPPPSSHSLTADLKSSIVLRPWMTSLRTSLRRVLSSVPLAELVSE